MNKRKKIGVFIDWYLPGFRAGGPIQSCVNMIEHLNEFADFKVITRNTDYTSNKEYENVKKNQWNTLENNQQVFYFSKDKLTANAIKDLILEENFDLIYLNGIFSYYFTQIPSKSFDKSKVIIAARGMLSPNALAVKKWKKKLFLWVSKFNGVYKEVVFHATNKDEENHIKNALGNETKVIVASNLTKKINITQCELREKKKGELKLINIARIAPEKNLFYALEILQNVKSNVVFDIYGPVYNEKYFEKCLEQIKKLPSNISVNYKGYIENYMVSEILQSYDALFMPTHGENFGHTIIESFLAGRPVIISDKTPWKNLENLGIGFDIPLTSRKRFTESIELLADTDEKKFHEYVAKSFDYGLKISKNTQTINEYKFLFNIK